MTSSKNNAAKSKWQVALAVLVSAVIIFISLVGLDTFTVAFFSILLIPVAIVVVLVVPKQTWSKRQFSFVISVLVAAILVPLTHWPLRLAFVASASWLNHIADRLEAGEDVRPQWAGAFFVRKAEINHRGMPVLWLHLDPSGYTGFARPHDGVAHGKFNDWSDYPLWGKWHHISED